MTWLYEEATAVSLSRVLLLGNGLINTAASVIGRWKENIDCEHGESQGEEGNTRSRRQHKDAAVTSQRCTQISKGQPKPPSAALACVELQDQILSKADRKVS